MTEGAARMVPGGTGGPVCLWKHRHRQRGICSPVYHLFGVGRWCQGSFCRRTQFVIPSTIAERHLLSWKPPFIASNVKACRRTAATLLTEPCSSGDGGEREWEG